MERKRIYNTWINIKLRCYSKKNKDYKNYGGRGIKICSEWANDFNMFYKWAILNGYKKGLSIDRIDNEKDYCPNNCRWANKHQQNSNRRKQCRNSTGFCGVIKEKNGLGDRFVARICYKGKVKRIGTFDNPLSAAEARDAFIKKNKLFEYPLQTKKFC